MNAVNSESSRKLPRAVIIGCGAISGAHIPSILNSGSAEIVAFCDVDENRAQSRRRQYAPNAAVYTDWRRMLAECACESVHVCTPHYLHAEMAIEALKLDKHVFLEKPLAIHEEEIDRILQAEANSRGKLCVCFQNRFNDSVVAARALCEKHGGVTCARGIVTWSRGGDYYTKSGWRGSYATEGGGVMINQAIHTLDLLIGFCGKPSTVSATVANHHLRGIIEVEDSCEAFIQFENGIKADFYATTSYGADAPIILEMLCADKSRVTIMGDRLFENLEPVEIEAEAKKAHLVYGKDCWGTGHQRLIAMFYDAIASGKETPVDALSSAYAVKVLLAAYRSGGAPITL